MPYQLPALEDELVRPDDEVWQERLDEVGG